MSAATWRAWAPKAGALCFAFLLWLYAVTENVYTREILVRLQVHDPASQAGAREVIVANNVPGQARIRVRGRGKELMRLDRDSYVVHLRTDGIPGTSRTYRLGEDMVEARQSSGVVVEQIVEPREVEVTLEWRLQRTVAVQPSVRVLPAEGYVLVGGLTTAPATAEISGPSSQMRLVSQVSTDSLVVVDADRDIDLEAPLLGPKCPRCQVTPEVVRVRGSIQLLGQDDVPHVPVLVRGPWAERYRVEPPEVLVRVRGGVRAIAAIEPEKDLLLYADLAEQTGGMVPVRHEGTGAYSVVEITPAYVRLVEK